MIFAMAVFHAMGRGLLSDQVAADIERRILVGELGASELLPTEIALAGSLGVSRTVVRDALRTLAARGLIEVRQGHGTRVAKPGDGAFGQALVALLMRSEVRMGDVMDARAALEIHLGPLAAIGATQEDFDVMDRLLDAFGASVAKGRWKAAHEEHRSFHFHLLEATHMPALAILLRPLHDVISLSSLPPRIDDPKLWNFERHPPILQAMKERDPEATREALIRHFDNLRSDLYAPVRAKSFRAAANLQVLDYAASREAREVKPPSRRRPRQTGR